jgi:enoyl-CoA hydratase
MTVTYERTGAAAVVTVDRPDRRNAIDGPTAARLNECLRQFEADEDARVMVLTGAGDKAFVAGADLKNLESLAGRVYLPEGPEGITRLTASKPTIAAVGGWCVAGGLELALWCDLRVASESARFGCLERRWGVPLLDGGTQRLPRIVGLGRALDLILTGRVVDAAEAHAMGLVTEVVPDGQALSRALELAELIAGFPQDTMLADRRATIEGDGLDLQAGLWLEARLGGASVLTGLAGAQRFIVGEGRSAAPTGGAPRA